MGLECVEQMKEIHLIQKALVLSIPFMSDDMNCGIIPNINQKEVMEDQVYMDKETLKALMTQYAIDHRF
ncbi:hypothetical protein KY290_008017 [Solanum tuberosum]|uniref:Uncharacterized protein n=1 Tax=Solanum tuberosum TaxID=4113 RepID=A0ABQ7W779_SOLTU|nr:hypothetical protein KY290_008017 [Solanum tuberosum]